MEKAREFQKNIYLCCTDYEKAYDCVDHNKLWKILKEMVIPDYLTCLLINLYVGQEATVRTRHEKTHSKLGECCILSPCVFNFYTGYIMQNARLDDSQAGIKIAGGNIRYANDIILPFLMVESEEDLKSS